MASKQQKSILGLAPLPSDGGFGAGGGLMPPGFGQALTRDQKRIYEEFHKQLTVIDAIQQKTIVGQSKIAELQQHSATTFEDTLTFIMEIKDRDHSPEHQRYLDEFSQRLIQLAAQHVLGALEVGATNIGLEIHRSLYLTADPLTFWQRVFGPPQK